jgi:hypothetical protein
MDCCGKTIASRSRYAQLVPPTCYLPRGHTGKCDQYPYLKHLADIAPHLAKKIRRDATMTTGAAWASSDAGPNRILRWVILQGDEQLREFGINIESLSPIIQAKLRDKAASYEDCMGVARRLTWSAYGVPGAPRPPDHVRTPLEAEFGPIVSGSTVCLICRSPFDFDDYAKAKRGKAVIETAHAAPRRHDTANVGFAHRACNIAQGDKTLDEFYEWIRKILRNVEAGRGHP